MAEHPSDVRTFLHLLKANPTILPPAPAEDAWRHIDHRTHDEVHTCLRCGGRAGCAFVADTTAGPRWLDMCFACGNWMRSGLPAAEQEEENARYASLFDW
jgi:hypothetical protein